MAVLNNGLQLLGVGADVTQIIKGLVLLLAVAFDVYNKSPGPALAHRHPDLQEPRWPTRLRAPRRRCSVTQDVTETVEPADVLTHNLHTHHR